MIILGHPAIILPKNNINSIQSTPYFSDFRVFYLQCDYSSSFFSSFCSSGSRSFLLCSNVKYM